MKEEGRGRDRTKKICRQDEKRGQQGTARGKKWKEPAREGAWERGGQDREGVQEVRGYVSSCGG
eukprot:3766440-Rhodomonas_salina.1